ncbi:MAG: hypothetical protein NZ580_03520 [Bacteroidia bacterium]|nr:hypothetical protein [Bacteroidia bacterium]MDW8235117.1 hypothetical protein [Bacteroidia bacterium]
MTYMLSGGWDVDTSLFIKLLPTEAQENQLKNLLVEVLLRTQKFRSEPTCDNEMYLNEKSAELLYRISIPSHKRLLYLLYHTFFTDYAFMYKSLSVSAWILHMPKHPRYFMAGFTFLVWLILATIVVLLLIRTAVPQKGDILLLYLMPISIIVLYIVIALVYPYGHYPNLELRYFATYTPILGFLYCVGVSWYEKR